MPSGYTAGVIEGKITTFEQFGKLCGKAMGAMIHMRDDSLDEPYYPDKVNNYHIKTIEKLENEITDNLSDEEIIKLETEKILKDIDYEERTLKDKENKLKILNEFLEKAKAYIPPTSEHEGIKDFMIKQLQETINWDCDFSWNKERLEKLKVDLKNIDPKLVKKANKEKIEKDIQYHKEQLEKEIKRVNDRNEWVETYFKSLENL